MPRKFIFEYFSKQLSYQIMAPLSFGQLCRISFVAPLRQDLQSAFETSPRHKASPWTVSGLLPTEPIPKPVGGDLIASWLNSMFKFLSYGQPDVKFEDFEHMWYRGSIAMQRWRRRAKESKCRRLELIEYCMMERELFGDIVWSCKR